MTYLVQQSLNLLQEELYLLSLGKIHAQRKGTNVELGLTTERQPFYPSHCPRVIKTHHCVQPTFIILCFFLIICDKVVMRLRLHTALDVLTGGLVNAGQLDLEETGCIQNMWTKGW